VRISCIRQAKAKSATDNLHGLSVPSRSIKLGRIPGQIAALKNEVSLGKSVTLLCELQ